jgi:hypothetical protein
MTPDERLTMPSLTAQFLLLMRQWYECGRRESPVKAVCANAEVDEIPGRQEEGQREMGSITVSSPFLS